MCDSNKKIPSDESPDSSKPVFSSPEVVFDPAVAKILEFWQPIIKDRAESYEEINLLNPLDWRKLWGQRIKFTCPSCDKTFKYKWTNESYVGCTVQCPKCKAELELADDRPEKKESNETLAYWLRKAIEDDKNDPPSRT